MSQGEYEMLALNSRRIMFFCSVCQPRSFNKMCSRQDLLDKRLQSIEQKLNNLTSNTQESDEMSTDESGGQLPKAGIDALRPKAWSCKHGHKVATASNFTEKVRAKVLSVLLRKPSLSRITCQGTSMLCTFA